MAELTEYEKERDARIARNKAVLAALGLETAAVEVKSLTGATKPAVSRPNLKSKSRPARRGRITDASAAVASGEESSGNDDMESEEEEYRPTGEENESDEEKDDNSREDEASDDEVAA